MCGILVDVNGDGCMGVAIMCRGPSPELAALSAGRMINNTRYMSETREERVQNTTHASGRVRAVRCATP